MWRNSAHDSWLKLDVASPIETCSCGPIAECIIPHQCTDGAANKDPRLCAAYIDFCVVGGVPSRVPMYSEDLSEWNSGSLWKFLD